MTIAPNLRDYDLILVNTSGGKDSSVAAWMTMEIAKAQGVRDRVRLVHATFPEEWPGTVALVYEQAKQLDALPKVVQRGESLLNYVRRRGKWPSPRQRYCTSDFKRAPIDKVITEWAPRYAKQVRPWRVLNVMGIRAAESPARAKRAQFALDTRRSNRVRTVDTWLPIFDWSTEEVWGTIRANQIPTHRAYALGMPRLSCVLCIYAPKAALVLAGRENPELLAQYVEVERETGHRFRQDLSIAEIQEAVAAGAQPTEKIESWRM